MHETPPLPVRPEDVVSRLAARYLEMRAEEQAAGPILAFDADGTLWSGDVGNDLFEALLEADAVRDEAREALAREAHVCGASAEGSATAIARALYGALEAEQYDEERAFGMMAWAFAGFSLAEAQSFAARVVATSKLEARLHRFLDPILEWAKAEAVPIWVVSASPHFIVELGVALFGIPASHVVAMTPRLDPDGKIIMPALAAPPVYGPAKPTSLRAACPEAGLLAAFGDSSYDVPLLAASRVPCAVRPKKGLLDRAAEIPGLVVLGT